MTMLKPREKALHCRAIWRFNLKFATSRMYLRAAPNTMRTETETKGSQSTGRKGQQGMQWQHLMR